MKRLIAFILLIVFCIVSVSFIVPQGQYALKFNHQTPIAKPILLKPGLHFKWPIMERVIFEPKWPQLLIANGATENPSLSIQTFDKHNLDIGYSLMWHITNPIIFYQANHAKNQLRQLREVLNKEITLHAAQLTLEQLLQADQQQIMINTIVNQLNKNFQNHGIKIDALFFNSFNVTTLERDLWTKKMSAQQETELSRLRQETAILSQTLRAETDNKIASTLAQGIAQADKIRAEGDLEANNIYANAYNKDPNFYEFFHNLQMYKHVLSNKQDMLVLSTHTPFFKSLSPDFNATAKEK